jgi:hypothetical protein
LGNRYVIRFTFSLIYRPDGYTIQLSLKRGLH